MSWCFIGNYKKKKKGKKNEDDGVWRNKRDTQTQKEEDVTITDGGEGIITGGTKELQKRKRKKGYCTLTPILLRKSSLKSTSPSKGGNESMERHAARLESSAAGKEKKTKKKPRHLLDQSGKMKKAQQRANLLLGSLEKEEAAEMGRCRAQTPTGHHWRHLLRVRGRTIGVERLDFRTGMSKNLESLPNQSCTLQTWFPR